MGRFPSGQRGQTVNLLSYDFDGSNPSLPSSHAEVAQLVEQHLDMVEVVGSSPIPRIIFRSRSEERLFCFSAARFPIILVRKPSYFLTIDDRVLPLP